MSLVEKIKELCEGKNTTLAGVERELGLGQGTIRKWDKSSPSVDKLQKVANYFNTSIDLLLGENSNLYGLDNIYLSLAKKAQDLELDPDDIDTIIRTVKEIKSRKKGGI